VNPDWILGQRLEDEGLLSLVLLSAAAEPSVRWEVAFKLPADVRAGLDDRRTEFFHVQACLRSPAELGVVWRFDRALKSLQGAPDRSDRVTGNLHIPLGSGEVRESSALACAPLQSPNLGGSVPAPGSLTASGATVRYPSANARHYLASRAAPGSERFEWEIIATQTGELAARLEQP